MKLWPKFWSGWERRKDDLREELEAHLRLAIEERIANGETQEEARAAAMRELGNPPLVADVTRGTWGWQWLERIAQDLRYSIRQLAKSPGYTVALLTTLTLGLGSVTSMLAIVDSVLVRPVGYPHAGQLVLIYAEGQGGTTASQYALSYKMADDMRRNLGAFSSLASYNSLVRPQRAQDGTRVSLAVEASPQLFDLLGIRPQLGRMLNAADANAPVVVINNEFWRDRLHADPKAIGSTIEISGKQRTVIGVLPPGFTFPQIQGIPAVYTPIVLNAKQQDEFEIDTGSVIARLKDGVTLEQARSQAQTFFNHANPAAAARHDVLKVIPYRDFVVGDVQKPLLALLGAVVVLLLISCANAANLQIGRAASRMEELQIRSALGASFGRLTQQLLVESLLVSFAGAVLGGGIAYLAVAAVRKAYGGQFARFNELAVHPVTIAAGVLLALVIGTAATLAPLLSVRRQIRAQSLRAGTRTATRTGRLPGILVSLQVALTCVLLATCGLFARTFRALENVNLGFNPHGVTTLVLVPENPHGDPESACQLIRHLIERFQSLPGVESVTMQTAIPFSSWNVQLDGTTEVEGRPWHEGDSAHYSFVSTDFVRTSGIKLLRGRSLEPQDEASGPIAVLVNQAFMQKYLANREPVGTSIRFHRDTGETDADIPFAQPMTIVGVVENELQGGNLGAPYLPMVYIDYLRLPKESMLAQVFSMAMQFAVRTRLPQDALAKELRAVIRQDAPQMVEMSLTPMEQSITNSLKQRRLALRLAGGFGAVALALSAVGIYGVLAYAVTLRRKEIGVRMALGASRGRVTGMVMRQAGLMLLFGIIPGIAGAWAAGHAVRSFLFGVKALDPVTLCAVGAVLLAVSILAALIPALRAAMVNPIEALRFE